MGQASEWRDKAAYYWSLSKALMDYDLCEHYAEIAARYLDIAEEIDDPMMDDAALGQSSSR
jgi:hypothetical protein